MAVGLSINKIFKSIYAVTCVYSTMTWATFYYIHKKICLFVLHVPHALFCSPDCDITFVSCFAHARKFLKYSNHFKIAGEPIVSTAAVLFACALFHVTLFCFNKSFYTVISFSGTAMYCRVQQVKYNHPLNGFLNINHHFIIFSQ